MRLERLLVWLLFVIPIRGQTTQGIIAGRINQLANGRPVFGALVSWTNAATNARGSQRSGLSGDYALVPLSPGSYVIRVEAYGFQARELDEVQVSVASRVELNFALRDASETLESISARPVSLPGNPFRVTLFGPDVEVLTAPVIVPKEEQSLLDSTRSQLIDPVAIRDLPFFGRDVYTMLVVQPGVSSEGGTVRGLGLSIDGQRPSSANFFLDGIETNNRLLSGPSLAIAPEAVDEYRVSTGNFSAEFGFSSGYIANAITRSGTNSWHGVGWMNLKNEALNANEFQNNRQGLPRPQLREFQPGYQLGGPLRRDKYFVSSSFDYLQSQGHSQTITVNLPTTSLLTATTPNSIARKLLEEFPAPLSRSDTSLVAPLSVAPPVEVNRWSAVERFDGITRGGADRLMGRLVIAQTAQPDFIWSPYKDFVSGLNQPVLNVAGSLTSSNRPQLSNEFRIGWSGDSIEWNRVHPEIPTLIDSSPQHVILPGSPAFYAFRDQNNTLQVGDVLFWTHGRHIVRFGGDFLLRYQEGFLSAGRDGRYTFPTLIDFSVDLPSEFSITLNRQNLPGLSAPDFERRYRYSQASGFLQDTWRISPRWTLNLGIRDEFFGAPVNTGTQKDARLALGTGSGFPALLSNAQLVFPSSSNQSLYRAPAANWAFRVGFSHDMLGNGRTVLRGGSGIFYDRPFDDAWQSAQSNNLALTAFDYQSGPGGYLAPISSVLTLYAQQAVISDFPPVTLFQANWKTGYAITQFLGVQQRIAENWSIEIQGVSSVGRHLLTTDELNRPFSVPAASAGPDNYNLSYNPRLPAVYYRGSQGSSNYDALSAIVHYRSSRYFLNLAYTLSHSIDNQSDPLAGDFLDLNFASLNSSPPYSSGGTFSRQFDSGADRGNSDFDQRQNLAFYSIWDLPHPGHMSWLLKNWKVAQMAAFRSGFPFSVYAPSSKPLAGGAILNNRADTKGPPLLVLPVPASGGVQILNVASFSVPAQGQLGSSGRNALRGPGLYNLDASISRSFTVRGMGESARLMLRADVFNVLNHANLGQPDPLITSPSFGTALFGRIGTVSGFPTLTPLRETARQVQLLIRLVF